MRYFVDRISASNFSLNIAAIFYQYPLFIFIALFAIKIRKKNLKRSAIHSFVMYSVDNTGKIFIMRIYIGINIFSSDNFYDIRRTSNELDTILFLRIK